MIDLRFVHPVKNDSRFVTPLGMTNDSRLVQSSKAPPSILVTLLGMETAANDLQPMFLQNTVYQ